MYEGINEVLYGDREDANETAFLARQLEAIKSRTYDVRYADALARRLLPVSHEAWSGATAITVRVFDWRGEANVYADLGDDFPRVDVFASEYTRKVYDLTASYGWSILEMRRSAMTGANLDRRKALASRRVIENAVDEIALLGTLGGKALPDTTGFFKDAGVTLHSLTNGTWSGLTGEQLLDDLIEFWDQVRIQSNDVFVADVIGLTPTLFGHCTKKRLNSADGRTVLAHFREITAGAGKSVEVISVPRLATADAGGSGPRIVAYARSEETVTLEMPQEYEEFPAVQDKMEFEIGSHAATAGAIIHHPTAVLYSDNAG